MPLHKYKLTAPNTLPIISIKLLDGSISSFEYSFDDKTKTSYYILPNGHKPTLAILLDSEGNEWDMIDVEYYSLLHNRCETGVE